MKNIMQAYKLKGKIDQSGNLLITEPLNLPPGNVEIVVWAATDTLDHTTTPTTEPAPEAPKRKRRSYNSNCFVSLDILERNSWQKSYDVP